MSGAVDPAQNVLVVLDPNFGDRLRDVRRGRPVWIVMSAANAPVVRALWAAEPDATHLTGVTGFRHSAGVAAEDGLLAELNTIELHHGSYSTSTPCTVIDVVGGTTHLCRPRYSDATRFFRIRDASRRFRCDPQRERGATKSRLKASTD